MSRGRDLPATEIALLRTVRSAVWGQMPVREHHAVAATGFAPVRREVVTMKSEGGPTTAEITGRAAERRTTPAVGRIAERFVAMIVAPAGVRRIAAAAVPACDHRIVEAAAPVAGLSIAVEAADLVVDRSVAAAAERVDDPLEAGHPAVRGPEAAAAVGVVRGSLLCPTIQPSSSTGVTLAEMLRQHVACGVLAVRLRRRRAASTIPLDQPV